MAEEFDFHPMWESLGMNLADHDMLLGAVGQMYGDMFLTQNNRPKSTSYLDFVATNIHSGRIKEMLDKKEAGEATKIVGSFCVYVPEEIVLACDGIPVGLCSGADWATDKVEEHLPRNTCPLIKSFAGFKLGEVCPYIESVIWWWARTPAMVRRRPTSSLPRKRTCTSWIFPTCTTSRRS